TAAEVPKKLGKLRLFWHSARPEPMLLRTKPRKVLWTPSGPTKSGFWRTTGVASLAPAASNRIGSPPCEEKLSSTAGVVPQRGVCRKYAAPTAAAPAAPGCPCSVG